MSTRRGRIEDIPALVALAEIFHAESGYAALAPIDSPSVDRTLRGMIESQGAVLLVSEIEGRIAGGIGALIFPLHFNQSVLAAQELFWWLLPAYRGSGEGLRMLAAIEGAVAEAGVKVFSMLSLERCRPEELAELYRRRGYQKCENVWWRTL